MLQKVRVEKRWKNDEKIWKRWKNGVICLVSMIASWVIVLKLSGKVHFLQFCADLSRKTKSIEAIYIYASERSFYALSGNGIAYYAMIYCFGDIRVWSQRTLLNFCWVSILFYILIANISWRVAQTPVNQYVAQTPVHHIIFWKSVMRTFRCIYVNSFNRLRFLAEVSTKLQKSTFLDNLRIITQEGNMETRQMIIFFSSTFSALTVCKTNFYIWK